MKKLPNLGEFQEAASKSHVGDRFSDPSKKRNTAHDDFNDKNLD